MDATIDRIVLDQRFTAAQVTAYRDGVHRVWPAVEVVQEIAVATVERRQ